MNQKVLIGLATALIIGSLGFLAFKIFHHQPASVEVSWPQKKHGGACPGETVELTQEDPYMRGILEKGDKFKVIMNYYDCNPIKRGDLVLYQFTTTMPPVVKIARGIPGDTFKTILDKKSKHWNLKINDELIKSVTDPDQNYFFGVDSAKPPIALYEKNHDGHLAADELIIMSSWPPGNKDSPLFGVTNITDIVGKVDMDSKPKEVKKK